MSTLSELCNSFFDDVLPCGSIDKNDLFCFKTAVGKFLKNGKKDDAFIVYFCFSEIFKLLGKGYDNTQKLLETLSDHEYHSGELLSKHRDHYSHSVYVFALGLAFYALDSTFRKQFDDFYSFGKSSPFNFLRLWGITALFHDIGYPFQLAHEQIKIYTEEVWGKNAANPYVSFGNLENFLAIDESVTDKLTLSLGCQRNFSNLNELLAYGINKREGYDYNNLCELLERRIKYQPDFMDHGYFSAVILLKQLFETPDFVINEPLLDVLTAILLHNSLNKYHIKNSHAIAVDEHPLAYLLMLCDELQNWDRLAYGKASKRDPIAWDISMSIRDNFLKIEYYFESSVVEDFSTQPPLTRLNKSFGDIQSGKFVKDIRSFISSSLNFNVTAVQKDKKKLTHLYASDDNFINLCDFAKAIHASYDEHCKDNSIEHINSAFADLPLEFKVSNIEQAKSYAYKLELINCFYSSKELDYPLVKDFDNRSIGSIGSDNLGFLCREEHMRWVKEKLSLGWKYGTDYADTAERNSKKIHKDIVPYEVLTEQEQSKDRVMINNIIPLLSRFGNIKIYKYRSGRKPDLVIAGTGHRFFTDNRDALKKQVKKILLGYSKEYRLIVRTCFSYGADQLIAECANELGITTKAVIPMDYESYIKDVREDALKNGIDYTDEDELNMRHLLAQTAVCKVMPDSQFVYVEASKYLVNNCDKLLAIWDGNPTPLFDTADNPINRGGTYDCIKTARERGLRDNEDIFIIKAHR